MVEKAFLRKESQKGLSKICNSLGEILSCYWEPTVPSPEVQGTWSVQRGRGPVEQESDSNGIWNNAEETGRSQSHTAICHGRECGFYSKKNGKTLEF